MRFFSACSHKIIKYRPHCSIFVACFGDTVQWTNSLPFTTCFLYGLSKLCTCLWKKDGRSNCLLHPQSLNCWSTFFSKVLCVYLAKILIGLLSMEKYRGTYDIICHNHHHHCMMILHHHHLSTKEGVNKLIPEEMYHLAVPQNFRLWTWGKRP